MSYEKQGFTSGQVLKASALNYIENGIEALSNEIDNIAVPTNISELSEDANHRTVTDEQITAWNSKPDMSELNAAVSEAETAVLDAQAAVGAAQGHANIAAERAEFANHYVNEAMGYSKDANDFAMEANQYALQAKSGATTSSNHATSAADSATAAAESERVAQTHMKNASNSATQAANSAVSAKDSATQAANSANEVLLAEARMFSDGVPEYWRQHLVEKIASIKALQDQGGKDCFSFVLLADTHYPSNLGKNSPSLAKRIMDECDIKFAILAGDAQTRGCHNTKELLLAENVLIEEMFAPIRSRLLQTEGNHDGAYGWLDRDGNGKYDNTGKEPANRESYVYNLTPAELHSAIYRKVGLVGDVHFDETGSGYYIDDTANKVRYIVLNTHYNHYEEQADGTMKYPKMWVFNFTQAQFNLVIDALNSIPSASWGVVVASHCPLYQEINDREIMQGVFKGLQKQVNLFGHIRRNSNKRQANWPSRWHY